MIDELNEQLATFQSRSASHSASKLNTPSNKQIIIDSSVAEVDSGLTNAYLGIDNRFTWTQTVTYFRNLYFSNMHTIVLLPALREGVPLRSFL